MDNDEIRISDLLYTVFKHRKTILVLGLLGFFCGFVFSGVSFLRNSRTNYAVNCSVAITSQPSADGVVYNNSDYLSSNTFYQTLDMMDAATFVMKSERTLQAAIDRAGLVSVTTQDVSQNLQVSRYNETQVLLLTLTWNNAEAGVQLMNALVDAIKEILPETLMMGSVAMIDAPEAASTTGGGAGQYVRLWVIFCVLGLAAGAGLAVLEFFLRPTLLNVKDVEDVLKLETLGSIPKDNSYFQKSMQLLSETHRADADAVQNFASAAHILINRFGTTAEPHWFYVTSAENGEGKSTVAANLALQLSDMEKRTLLLDLNTRAPRLGGMFLQDLPYSRTLNALYKGESAEPEAVISLTGYLDLLPMVLEPDAVPLDAALFDFLKPIMEPYEYVIIDASSVGRSSDVLRLNKLADHALFVVRHDATPLPVIQDAIEKLNKSGVQLLGCVVNEVQSLEIFPLHPEHIAAPIRKKKKKPENADSPLPEDLLRPADSALEPTWKPAGDGRSVMDELTDDLQRSQNTRSDDEIMWELLRMGKDGSWKRPERKPTADSSAAQPPQSIPDAPPASGAAPAPQPVPETPPAPVPAEKPKTVPKAPPAPAPVEKPKPVQPKPEAESKAGLLPWTEPEPEPKPEKKRSRAPKPAAAPKHGKASSRSGLGLWGKNRSTENRKRQKAHRSDGFPACGLLQYSCSLCSGLAADRVGGIVKGLRHTAGILRGHQVLHHVADGSAHRKFVFRDGEPLRGLVYHPALSQSKALFGSVHPREDAVILEILISIHNGGGAAQTNQQGSHIRRVVPVEELLAGFRFWLYREMPTMPPPSRGLHPGRMAAPTRPTTTEFPELISSAA